MTPGRDGLVVVDKPAGWTSHDVVARCRRLLSERRVGHAGTLDPGATGVLLVGVGAATRLMRFLGALPKSYHGEIVLGVATDTLDDDGRVVAVHDMSSVTPADVEAAAGRFVGVVEQVPPMVSAVKVGGRRLHQLAREGTEVPRPARQVTVHRLEVSPARGNGTELAAPDAKCAPQAPPVEPGVYEIDVSCSSGTYVRALAADIGAALGGGAHLRRLRRTAVGPFTLADAIPLERVDPEALLPPAAALRGHESVTVGGDLVRRVGHGQVLEAGELGVRAGGEGPWAVLDERGELLAVYEPYGPGVVKPAVVIAGGGGR